MEVVRVLCERGIDRHVVNKQGHSVIDLVRDVDIGAEIQSYDLVEEDDIDDRTFPFSRSETSLIRDLNRSFLLLKRLRIH